MTMFETEYAEHKKHYLLESEHPFRHALHLAVEIGRKSNKKHILYSIELGKRIVWSFPGMKT